MKYELQSGSRSILIAGLLLFIIAVFIIRLFWLQVVQHDYYVGVASREQVRRLVVPAERGEIYSLDMGVPNKLVLNQTVYTVFADPQTVSQPDEIVKSLDEVAGGNTRDKLKDLLTAKNSRYQILATGLTDTQAEMLKDKGYAGIGFQKENQRVYPEGSLAAQTLGFVDGEGEGKYGIEGGMNSQLAGKDGLLQSVVDVSEVPLSIGGKNIKQPAEDGKDVVLTIDRNIQHEAEKALKKGMKNVGADEGSVVIMDPNSGQIMSMANYPTFNPSKYFKVKDAAAFNNPVISDPYEPGSDIKTLTMATGIDTGVASAKSTYVNTDHITVADRTISNASKGETGRITFQHALNWSLNTGFVTVLERMGGIEGKTGHATINQQAREVLYKYFHDKLRLGQLTGLPLAGESAGIMIGPNNHAYGSLPVRYSNVAFGQGMDITMVQVAAAFGAIINGGDYYTPSVVAGTIDNDTQAFNQKTVEPTEKKVIKKQSSRDVTKMIHEARQAFYASHDKKGYYVGGKTGTSQTLENGKYVDNQTIATYLGYGGSDLKNLNYVIMVRLSGKGKNLEGGKHAMPVFTDISNWMLDYLKLAPGDKNA